MSGTNRSSLRICYVQPEGRTCMDAMSEGRGIRGLGVGVHTDNEQYLL